MGNVSERAEVIGPAALPRDILPRAISGLILGAVALLGNWAGHAPFSGLVLAIAVVMSWEWSRIVRGAQLDVALVLHAGVVAGAVLLATWGAAGWALVLLMLGTLSVALIAPVRLLSALGVVYVGLPSVAMVWLRGGDAYGAAAIFFIFAIVWTTDTFAYFCGRALGGPKLWPALSPRKTWSGTLGGIAFAALAGAIFAVFLPRPAAVMLAMVAIALSIVAQIGDLAESALKRAFSVKNASDLIPGHGGFMDRMDGVVTAATLAALLALLKGAHSPAESLLFWS